ncbi:MAG: spore cortex biosynthesis protein YabQ [Clostridia bacterium]|nr:spore cortex biosynthesis protein YabQ [Clostridia bacterium]
MDFLLDILAGIVVWFGYDFFNTLRHRFHNKGAKVICDICFWLFAGALILGVLFYTADMALRAYEFLGILTGICFYYAILSDWLSPFHKKIADIFFFFYRILFTILRFFAIMIKNGFLCLWFPFRWLGSFSRKIVAKPMRAIQENKKLIKRI